jgi:hypothetical protein
MTRPVFGTPKQHISLADTKMSINGCQVLMGHPDPAHAQAAAKVFKSQLSDVINRSVCVTMGDFYAANMDIQKKIELGESLIN